MDITKEQADAIGPRLASMWGNVRECEAMGGRFFEEAAHRWRIRAIATTRTLEALDIPCHLDQRENVQIVGEWEYPVPESPNVTTEPI